MMVMSMKCMDLIKAFEGFFPEVYLCPAGYPTVGYGHLVRQGEDFSLPLSPFEAEQLLWNDLQSYQESVRRLINVPLTQGQFDALVSFTYNLGAGALQRSAMRAKINREEHESVPREMMRWVWAGGRKLKGLIRRRQAEGLMYQT